MNVVSNKLYLPTHIHTHIQGGREREREETNKENMKIDEKWMNYNKFIK